MCCWIGPNITFLSFLLFLTCQPIGLQVAVNMWLNCSVLYINHYQNNKQTGTYLLSSTQHTMTKAHINPAITTKAMTQTNTMMIVSAVLPAYKTFRITTMHFNKRVHKGLHAKICGSWETGLNSVIKLLKGTGSGTPHFPLLSFSSHPFPSLSVPSLSLPPLSFSCPSPLGLLKSS